MTKAHTIKWDFFKPKIIYMEIQTDNPKEGYPFPCFSYDAKTLSKKL